MNILIVEDSAPMRRMIHSLVAPLALNIFECSDGGEALAVYQAHQPDWVLMDLRLGQVDGITATQRICDAYPRAKVEMFATGKGEVPIYKDGETWLGGFSVRAKGPMVYMIDPDGIRVELVETRVRSDGSPR